MTNFAKIAAGWGATAGQTAAPQASQPVKAAISDKIAAPQPTGEPEQLEFDFDKDVNGSVSRQASPPKEENVAADLLGSLRSIRAGMRAMADELDKIILTYQ